jgi:hypothetical protein
MVLRQIRTARVGSPVTPKQRALAAAGGSVLSLLLTWALDWDLHIGVLSSGSGATPVVGHSDVRLQLVYASQAQRSRLWGSRNAS